MGAPPPPAAAVPPGPTPSGGTDPSFAGAIMALVKSLASIWAPKAIQDQKLREQQQESQALGTEFKPER